jgi:hypothetical protein
MRSTIVTKQKELFQFVESFVKQHKISCPESIYQNDELQLGAPEFMEKCVNIVGYYDCDKEEGAA